MFATLTNMRTMQARGATHSGPDRIVAYNPATGEEFSANPGDYWYLGPDECLKERRGRKLVLAYVRPEQHVPCR